MNPYVLDASVVIKWFVPEEFSDEARRWRTAGGLMHVPDFFFVEANNIVWKKVMRDDLAHDDADAIAATLLDLPFSLHPATRLLPAAYKLACETGRTVYDCLYLALAIELGGRMVTADRRLVNALASTPHAAHLCWVEDSP